MAVNVIVSTDVYNDILGYTLDSANAVELDAATNRTALKAKPTL